MTQQEATARGGAILGEGKHGASLNAHRIAGDAETLHAQLERAPRTPRWKCWVDGDERRSGRALTDEQMAAMVGAAAAAKRTIAKRMTEPDYFAYENEIVGRVTKVYGKDTPEFTAIGGLAVKGVGSVQALQVPGAGAFFILSHLCETALDRFPFKRASEIDAFVRDILDSLARLHAAGVLHADLKLDNMIWCGDCQSSRGRSFRLIDWGNAVHKDRLLKRARNSASPLAWYFWGLGRGASGVASTYKHLAEAPPRARASAEYIAFVAGANASAAREIARLERAAAGAAGVVLPWTRTERTARRAAAERHWRSVDTYNFGGIMAMLAAATPGGKQRRKALTEVATKLTHFDAEGFCEDAAEARRMYDKAVHTYV